MITFKCLIVIGKFGGKGMDVFSDTRWLLATQKHCGRGEDFFQFCGSEADIPIAVGLKETSLSTHEKEIGRIYVFLI